MEKLKPNITAMSKKTELWNQISENIYEYVKLISKEELLRLLPEEAPEIVDILGTEEEHKDNEIIRARISGFNSCLRIIKDKII